MAPTNSAWLTCPVADGDALRAAREQHGHTRHTLAHASGVTQHRLRNLEATIGTRWRPDELSCIAVLLQTTPAALCVADTPAAVLQARVRALGTAVDNLPPSRRTAFVRDVLAVLEDADGDPAA